MQVCAVIPARYGSTRFPGKPLALIHNKPLLQWVIEGVRSAQCLDHLIVATDDSRIESLCQDLEVDVVMTDSDLPSGSDRVWAAVKNINCDVVVNVQGDEPLITAELIDQLVAPFQKDAGLEMATLAESLKPEDAQNSNVVKLILNKESEAIYFSRFNIPYSKNSDLLGANLKHIGLYAYKKEFLKHFCNQKPVAIEKMESLEQLRALYMGARIKVISVQQFLKGVDTPEDAKQVEKILSSRS
ncbi:MAG: 3-deoxy-manno-octulosonate cytidylyltransferase [Bdellovibrionales bacterium]|nr:3-deoxy-manno-octulosonate cytidylyltransferase [Bdellovibrionales bacterium]